jgi:hypothetical protein
MRDNIRSKIPPYKVSFAMEKVSVIRCLMQEKRHYPRYIVEGVEGTLMFTTHVDVLNISISGVALKANRRLEIGREYTLKLEYRERTVSVNGVVVWSVLSELTDGPHAEKVPVYKAGMRFTDIMSEKMTRLLEFIESHKLSQDERLNIRFTIKAPDKAILDGPHNYDVRNMSISGMRIETDMRFDVGARYPMEISLEGNRTVKVLGKVVSCLEVNDRAPKHYAIGIEFVEISDEDRKRVKEFVDTL